MAENAAVMAAPWLVGVGIDRGIPALRRGDAGPLLTILAALIGCAVLDALLRTAFLLRLGRIGQDVLLDLRRRLFDHFQRLLAGLPRAVHLGPDDRPGSPPTWTRSTSCSTRAWTGWSPRCSRCSRSV